MAASALLVGACGGNEGPPSAALSTGGSGNGGSGNGGSGGTQSAAGQGGLLIQPPPITIEPDPTCTQLQQGTPVFSSQVMSGSFARELYSWTTDEQVTELRAGKVLLTRSEREGLGPGFAFEMLQQLAKTNLALQGQLATVLTSEAFAKGRYAWPNPWATRMGWPGETYGNRLVRMLLKPEAWLAVFQRGGLKVVDAANGDVALEDALLHPERLAGFYFIKDASAGGPVCGTFAGGGNAYREFIVSNESMIEEWSLGTETIRQRLLDDISRLEVYFARTRACPEPRTPFDWNLSVGCDWQRESHSPLEQGAYEGALAMPSPAYLPAPAQLAALIDALRADLFEPDPLVVRPGG